MQSDSYKFWSKAYICYPICPVWCADAYGDARTKPRSYGILTWPAVKLWCIYVLNEFPITMIVGDAE